MKDSGGGNGSRCSGLGGGSYITRSEKSIQGSFPEVLPTTVCIVEMAKARLARRFWHKENVIYNHAFNCEQSSFVIVEANRKGALYSATSTVPSESNLMAGWNWVTYKNDSLLFQAATWSRRPNSPRHRDFARMVYLRYKEGADDPTDTSLFRSTKG